MAGENGGTDNPLSQGSDPHSVESAAADFTAMLSGDAEERPAREPRKPAEREPEKGDAERNSGKPPRQPPKEERREAGENDQDDDRGPRDPILDDGAEADDGDKGDDEETDDDQDDGDDQDDDDQDDGDDPSEAFLEAKHTVTVNGKAVEVTGREALAGYMKDADYRQGTERNAREYEEIQNFAVETVEHRKRAVDSIDQTLALMASLQPTEQDWAALKAGDPQKYIAAQEHWQGIQAKAKELFEKRQAFVEDAGKTAVKRDQKYFQDQERALVTALPALRDAKKADAFRSAVMEYGLAAGYSEKELIEGAVDHRDLITLYKAAQYDKSRKAVAEAQRRGNNKGPKPSGDGRAKANKRQNNGMRNADKRLARTGSLQDAADGFRNMILAER